ncbi:hypothetical protein [Nonomuraea rhodomycinica]|uniref:Uncharacterized protein n=1 Tax=Nonomuraea rhodomycinica TaxID=1712872 RepID=A0A7Y6IZ76_9ACTN|nr:hypothetical protein [Nonomuraea rhodomycinica]NUW46860.1 hypothetical protein [Nonomuraea rhodomycinica]
MVTVVDAQRIIQVAALVVMSLALVVRLRSPGRTSGILDRRDSSAKAGGVP